MVLIRPSVGIYASELSRITINIAPGVVTSAAINSVPAPTRWQSIYSHFALNHLSATIPSSVGMKTAAIPSEL